MSSSSSSSSNSSSSSSSSGSSSRLLNELNVARPTLLYGSESWVTTKRDMTRLEAAEMRFLRSVKGYTRLDKIRSEVIRKKLEISGIQDMRSKHKQNWINHLERMDNTRLPKYALNYKPRGRRDCGRTRKRWQRVDARTGQST
jgi:hypothetical protein